MAVAFITGASSGFGESCARRFAKEGWNLILAARRVERIRKLKQELNKICEVHLLKLDVQDLIAVQQVIKHLPKEFKEIEVLINNAGLALGLEPAHRADLNDWETMINTNIKGLIYCTHTVLPLMVQQNRGHIINIGSIAGNWPYPGGNVYGATKAFVQQFSRNLRADLLGTKIRITNIEPGLAETEFSIVRFKGDKAKANQVYKGVTPLCGEDIAEIAYWVISLPPHVNINSVEVMPTDQAWGPLSVSKNK